jgi:hypothetical protein
MRIYVHMIWFFMRIYVYIYAQIHTLFVCVYTYIWYEFCMRIHTFCMRIYVHMIWMYPCIHTKQTTSSSPTCPLIYFQIYAWQLSCILETCVPTHACPHMRQRRNTLLHINIYTNWEKGAHGDSMDASVIKCIHAHIHTYRLTKKAHGAASDASALNTYIHTYIQADQEGTWTRLRCKCHYAHFLAVCNNGMHANIHTCPHEAYVCI